MTKEEALKIALSCLKSKTFNEGVISDIEKALNEEADEMHIQKETLMDFAIHIIRQINVNINQEYLDTKPKSIGIEFETKNYKVSFIVTGKKNEVLNETSNQP